MEQPEGFAHAARPQDSAARSPVRRPLAVEDPRRIRVGRLTIGVVSREHQCAAKVRPSHRGRVGGGFLPQRSPPRGRWSPVALAGRSRNSGRVWLALQRTSGHRPLAPDPPTPPSSTGCGNQPAPPRRPAGTSRDTHAHTPACRCRTEPAPELPDSRPAPSARKRAPRTRRSRASRVPTDRPGASTDARPLTSHKQPGEVSEA